MFICSVLCLVNLLACTIFENICLPFFLHKLTSICRQNWSCEEMPSSQSSDKAASLILPGSGKHERMYKKSATVTHFTINHAFQTPCSLFLPSKSSTLDILVFSKSFYSETLAKHSVYVTGFVLLYIHRLAR